ncbi:MAG: SIMPL domain-containing protein [Alphaproteobacteria bacterium]
MRSTFAGVLALLTMLAVAGMACAQEKPATGRDETNTVITFSTSAERAVPRDRLRATLRAEASDPDPVKVQNEINKRMGKALDRVKRTSAVKAETGSYSIYQVTDKNRIVTWRGSQSISVYSGDFDAVLGVVRDLQADGLAMSGMGFELTPEMQRKLEQELEAEAVSKALERARALAKAAESSVVRIRALRVGGVPLIRPLPMAKGMESDQMMAAAMAPPVAEGGDQTVRVSVDVDVLVAPVR